MSTRTGDTTRARRVPLLDLVAQHRTIRDEVMNAIARVVESQRFILGEEVELLERELAGYCTVRHAIGCASGSDALILALRAFDVGPGDEVLTTPYTFFATAGAIHHTGARPVFVDIEDRTFNMDASRVGSVLDAHPRIRAVVPVHLYGGCADMDELRRITEARGIPIIEDAAQAIGAEYCGRRAGSMGEIGCFSFFPSKNLGAYGDGGLLTTNDDRLADKLRALRVHGSRQKYIHEWVGMNSRLDALQAAVLRVKLKHLDRWHEGRQRNADRYRRALAGVPVTLPAPASFQTRHIYNQFVVRCPGRDELRKFLSDSGIGTEIYYPVPLHLQQCFAHLGFRQGDFPVSESLSRDSLALPVYAELEAEDIQYVADTIRSHYG